MKHCVLQDSSFLIASLDENDIFHKDAIFIFKHLIKNRNDIKVIIPTLVFYETIISLIKKGGISRTEIERKLWNFLYHDMVINISLLKTPDFIIVNTGIEFDAQILTFDRQMINRVKLLYPQIYYCSEHGGFYDQTLDFLTDFYKKIGKGDLPPEKILS